MATFKAVVFQTGRHIKLDGTSNIKIRIVVNRESCSPLVPVKKEVAE